ncbi:hypothetical protein HanPSC8_Chr01g0032341 [Helianthus annuus]|nr:hypothetical protein HanPSC8_Chr01g0032341 [Helianthus annuus]
MNNIIQVTNMLKQCHYMSTQVSNANTPRLTQGRCANKYKKFNKSHKFPTQTPQDSLKGGA